MDYIQNNQWAQVEEKNITLNDLGDNLNPNRGIIRQLLPNDIVQVVTTCINKNPLTDDKRVWSLTAAGNFSISSWRKHMATSDRVYPYHLIWSEFVPPKVSLFSWKLVHGILPTDNAVQKCGVSLYSKCLWCPAANIESASHLLLHSNLSTSTWALIKPCFHVISASFAIVRAFLLHAIQQTNTSTIFGLASLLIIYL